MRRRWRLAVSLALMLAAGSVRSSVPPVDPDLPPGVKRLVVTAVPLEEPPGKRGALDYLGGYVLSADSPDFGGLSGLQVLPDGALLMVSDVAHWVWLKTLRAADGRITGLREGLIAPILDRQGQKLSKKTGDAEALSLAQGAAWVAYEGDTRIERFDAPFATDPARAMVARPLERISLSALGPVPENGGPEAMTHLPGGGMLVISEEGKGPGGGAAALLRVPGQPDLRFGVLTSPDFKPTDIAVLSAGRLLLLTRRYVPLVGVSVEIGRLDLAEIRADASVRPVVLARLETPFPVDNMEAISTEQIGGRTIITLVADDNFNPLQRTLLMQFAIK